MKFSRRQLHYLSNKDCPPSYVVANPERSEVWHLQRERSLHTCVSVYSSAIFQTSFLFFCLIFTKLIIGDNIFCPWRQFFCATKLFPCVSERTCSLYLPVCPHVCPQSTVLQTTCITFIWHTHPLHKSELTFVSYFLWN